MQFHAGLEGVGKIEWAEVLGEGIVSHVFVH